MRDSELSPDLTSNVKTAPISLDSRGGWLWLAQRGPQRFRGAVEASGSILTLNSARLTGAQAPAIWRRPAARTTTTARQRCRRATRPGNGIIGPERRAAFPRWWRLTGCGRHRTSEILPEINMPPSFVFLQVQRPSSWAAWSRRGCSSSGWSPDSARLISRATA